MQVTQMDGGRVSVVLNIFRIDGWTVVGEITWTKVDSYHGSELFCISRSDILITWDALCELIAIGRNVSCGTASYFCGGI